MRIQHLGSRAGPAGRIDPCFVYHPLNAFDDRDDIIFDVVRHDRTFVDGKSA